MTKRGNHDAFPQPTKSEDAITPNKRIIKYRVAIKQPEEWKIQSIAEYKLRQKLKSEENELRKKQEEAQQEQGKKNGKETTGKSKDLKIPKETDIKIAYESHVRELANCHFTGAVAKARIAALHSVRVSLLWLLKKSSLHERALIQDHLQPLNSSNSH